jgi:hypothetical protein
MTKEKWIAHMENSTGATRPSNGGSPDHWKQLIADHKSAGCLECKERAKTKKATMNRKMKEDVMRSCGLTKVYGAVTRQVYWE